MIQIREARRIASDLIEHVVDSDAADVVIDHDRTVETDTHWVFFYNSRQSIETGAIIYALAGNAPIFVSKSDGRAGVGRTDIPIQQQIDEWSHNDSGRS
jgi:hypothetical protein